MKKFKPPYKNKFGNHKVEVDGHTFDSLKEAHYFTHLKMCMNAQEKDQRVTEIELQPEFTLIPKFEKNGRMWRPLKYRADFRVTYADGRKEIVDVKGFKTQEFAIKQKLFEYTFKDLSLKIV